MSLVPFNRRNRRLNPVFDDFYNALDDFFGDNWPVASWPVTRLKGFGSFKIDIQESDKEYVVEAKLPGVRKDEINLDFDDSTLYISISRDESVKEDNKNYVYRETRQSSMNRSIYLPNALSDGIRAKLENGVLYIHVPKQERSVTGRRIEIE